MAVRLPPMQALRAFEAAARGGQPDPRRGGAERHARGDQPSDQVARSGSGRAPDGALRAAGFA